MNRSLSARLFPSILQVVHQPRICMNLINVMVYRGGGGGGEEDEYKSKGRYG